MSELEGADKKINVILSYLRTRMVSDTTLLPISQNITRNEKQETNIIKELPIYQIEMDSSEWIHKKRSQVLNTKIRR